MEIFKGKIKDFTGRTLLEEAREEYEKIKDPALDAAAEKLLKALADYLNLAIEKRDTVAISSIYEAMVGGAVLAGRSSGNVAGRAHAQRLQHCDRHYLAGDKMSWR